jgi:hypothetical protein
MAKIRNWQNLAGIHIGAAWITGFSFLKFKSGFFWDLVFGIWDL